MEETEKKERFERFQAQQASFVASATGYGFTEDQAIFLFQELYPVKDFLGNF